MKLIIDIPIVDYETLKEVDELGGCWKTDIASRTMGCIGKGVLLDEIAKEIKERQDNCLADDGEYTDGMIAGLDEALYIVGKYLHGKGKNERNNKSVTGCTE